METIKKLGLIVIKCILGGILIYGGFAKFSKPIPQPDKFLEVSVGEKAELLKNVGKLKVRNYIFGLKQSDFFWQFLGIAEITAGVLLITQVFGFIGALIAFPQVLNIFLFHVFLDAHEVDEVILTGCYLLMNILVFAAYYSKWKHLVKVKVW